MNNENHNPLFDTLYEYYSKVGYNAALEFFQMQHQQYQPASKEHFIKKCKEDIKFVKYWELQLKKIKLWKI